jgi:hypothetical protein
MTLKKMITDGDRKLPFDDVWKSCRTKERSKLLRQLTSGEIRAEGIRLYHPHETEDGEFEPIPQALWLDVTKEQVGLYQKRKLRFSLKTDDDGAGFFRIFLLSNAALLALLPLDQPELDTGTLKVLQSQTMGVNQMFGHEAYCEAYYALFSGLVPPTAAKLAYHLADLKGIWPKGTPKEETIMKVCRIVVDTYNKHKKKP